MRHDAVNSVPLRIVVADGRSLVREGLCRLIEGVAGMHVQGEADGFNALRHVLGQRTVDVVVVGAGLRDWSDADLAAMRKRNDGRPFVVMLSADPRPGEISRALQNGISGLLLPDATAEHLADALRMAASGGVALCPSTFLIVFSAYVQQRMLAQELRGYKEIPLGTKDIVALFISGNTMTDVAEAMELSVESLESRMQALMAPLGIHDTDTLLREAARWGVIESHQGIPSAGVCP